MDELERDAAKLRELEKQAADLRASIRARVLAELRSDTPQVELVRRTGWTRETIRKIKQRGGTSEPLSGSEKNP